MEPFGMQRFEYVSPSTLVEALAQLGQGRAIKAGGVDLVDRMKEGLDAPEQVINIRTIASLEGVRVDDDGLTIGPLTTLAALAAHPSLRDGWRAIAQAASQAATPQIRNMATAGGNLLQRPRCWYFRSADFPCLRKGGGTCYAQDGANRYHAIFGNDLCAMVHPSALAVPLTALGATLELTSEKGARRVPIADFYVPPGVDPERECELGAGEILTAIRVPALPAGTVSNYRKQKERDSADWPLVEVAVVLEKNDGIVRRASIVLGAVAAVPHRALAAENVLHGKRITAGVARTAAVAASRGTKPLSGNAYKIALLETAVRRAILEAAS